MHFEKFSFGSVQIDGTACEHDVVIDRGEVRKAQEKAIQAISRTVRPHAAVHWGRHTLEMPPARDWDGCLLQIAGDARSAWQGRT